MRTQVTALALFVVGLTTATQHLAYPQAGGDQTIESLTAVLALPLPAENDTAARNLLARQQAEAAVALVRAGRQDLVWPLLRQSDDNSRRSYLIHLFGSEGVDPTMLVKRLEVEQDTTVRRALILSLGSFTGDRFLGADRQRVVPMLLRWYRDDPDPGVRSAVDWLLRHSHRGRVSRPIDWNQQQALQAIDRELTGSPPGPRSWYLTREAQMMVVVRGPVELRMGSPAHERPRRPASDSAEEPLHVVRVPRSFAIGSKEVTVAEFRRFLDANPEVRRRHGYPGNPDRMAQVMATFSPDDDGPQIAVTWYEAAMYCNWLSKQDDLARTEWVYPVNVVDVQDGMELPADYLHRRGYRLPTEAEWEYATRAGSVTARFYGAGDSLLEQYAWYSKNPPRTRGDRPDPSDPQRTWPVGQLKPNDLGLFDVYGNVWEWMQDRMREVTVDGVRLDVEDDVRRVTDDQPRVRRGGGFPYEAAMMRSAHRGPITALPTNRRDNVGFRVARTYR